MADEPAQSIDQVGPEADEEVDLATSDELVEEVSIDSMCGVK